MNIFPSKRVSDSYSDNRQFKGGPADQKRPRGLKWMGLVTIAVTFALCGAVAEAQQPGKIPWIGYLAGAGSSPNQAFLQALRDLGMRLPSSVYFAHHKRVAELTMKNRLPSIATGSNWVDAGGLMSYGQEFSISYRRAATYVDKILKGAKPADLPVEAPTKFELRINLQAAKQIRLTIPQSVLFRADKVIK